MKSRAFLTRSRWLFFAVQPSAVGASRLSATFWACIIANSTAKLAED
jgi:hypothetical protein